MYNIYFGLFFFQIHPDKLYKQPGSFSWNCHKVHVQVHRHPMKTRVGCNTHLSWTLANLQISRETVRFHLCHMFYRPCQLLLWQLALALGAPFSRWCRKNSSLLILDSIAIYLYWYTFLEAVSQKAWTFNSQTSWRWVMFMYSTCAIYNVQEIIISETKLKESLDKEHLTRHKCSCTSITPPINQDYVDVILL